MAVGYKTKDAAKYQKEFAEYVVSEVERQQWDVVPDRARHFYIDTVFYFERPDRDANNYFKVLLDAITDTKLIWLDDNVTCERVQRICYDRENPRVELHIHPVDYIGVFDDATQLAEFQSNCIDCRRYSRNCSLLSNAIAGHVQSEIHDGVCEKRTLLKQRKGAKGNGKEETDN